MAPQKLGFRGEPIDFWVERGYWGLKDFHKKKSLAIKPGNFFIPEATHNINKLVMIVISMQLIN